MSNSRRPGILCIAQLEFRVTRFPIIQLFFSAVFRVSGQLQRNESFSPQKGNVLILGLENHSSYV